jgi:feruloyl esterase
MFSAAMLVPTARCWAQTVFESGCSALRGLKISASQIALPTAGASIEEAAWVGPTDAKSAACLASGAIHPLHSGSPDIRFKIILPAKWNGKAVQLGGGGYDGSVADRANFLPLQPSDKGYASYGSDSGHQGPPTSAAFALDPEALDNYAGAQIKKTHDVATAVFLKLYGKAPTRTYFYGNSHGGNEALQAIHSFPSDYDGVIAIHPAYDTIAVQVGGILASQVMYGSASSWISPSKLNAVGQAVLEACDGLDGARDGLISNTAACRQQFKIESLRCQGDAGSDAACLTEAQIAALRKLASPLQFGFALKGGVSSFGGWPVFEGAFTDPHNPSGWGNRPAPGAPPTSDDAAQFIMADQAIRYLITNCKRRQNSSTQATLTWMFS